MIVELAAAAVLVDMGRSVHWLVVDGRKKHEASRLLRESIVKADTWGDILRDADERKEKRPDLFEREPVPPTLRIVNAYFRWRRGE